VRDDELSRGADVGVDPFFTARVLDSLPPRPVGATLSPLRRLAVLVLAYGGAAGIGYAALGDESSATMTNAATALRGLDERTRDDLPVWGGAVVLPIALLVVAFVAGRSHLSSGSGKPHESRPFG
jgi:hypothetical protein